MQGGWVAYARGAAGFFPYSSLSYKVFTIKEVPQALSFIEIRLGEILLQIYRFMDY